MFYLIGVSVTALIVISAIALALEFAALLILPRALRHNDLVVTLTGIGAGIGCWFANPMTGLGLMTMVIAIFAAPLIALPVMRHFYSD